MTSDLVVIGTALVTLLLPGTAVGLSTGLRPSTALAVAPALTFGLVTTAATVSSLVDVPWNPWTGAAGTVVACLIALAARFAARRFHRSTADRPEAGTARAGEEAPTPSRRSTGADAVIVLGVVAGWALSATVLLRSFGSLDNLNQDWDYVFHANALRLIADTSDADPAALRSINDWEVQNSFYPNAFHALGAIVRDLTGAPVFTVLNSMSLLITLVAGAGLAGLLRAVRAPVAVSAATPVLLAGFASFPYDTLWRGPLLPYATGVALIPAFFLLLVEALRRRDVLVGAAAGLAAAALLGVQTSTALSAALVAVPFLVQRWATAPRRVRGDLLPLATAGIVAVVLAQPFVTGALSMSSSGRGFDWPAVETPAHAVGDLLLSSHASPTPQYWLSGLVIVGLLSLRSARYMWWWLAGGAMAGLLFVLAASLDTPLVQTLTSPWWNDRWRFAAVAVLALAPLAAHGLQVLALAADAVVRRVVDRRGGRGSGAWSDEEWADVVRSTQPESSAGPATNPLGPHRVSALSTRLQVQELPRVDEPARSAPRAAQGDPHRSLDRTAALAGLGLAAVFALSHGLYADANTARTSGAYQSPGQLDGREVEAMRWLAEQPGHLGAVMNDPADGSPYMSALFGLHPVFGHILIPDAAPGETQRLLLDHFNCLDSSPAVRAAVEQQDIQYVFVSSGYVRTDFTRVAGLVGLDEVASLEEVYSAADGLRIYRVLPAPAPAAPSPACALPSG